MKLFENKNNIEFQLNTVQPITPSGLEKYRAYLEETDITFKEVISDIIEDSICTPHIGSIDICIPPMWDGLHIGGYIKEDLIDEAPMPIIKSYFNYKIATIAATKKENHIDYYIILREEE